MEFNLADLFEHAVDHFPDREYLACDGKRRTYREMEERANRMAHHLAAHGIGCGDHVGIYALNSVAWVETLWAVFKLRAVWININYRYVEEELRYLFDNADLKALVYERQFAPRVAHVLPAMPLLRHSIVVEDGTAEDYGKIGSVEYEAAMASGSPARDFGPRSADDRYILYTGGTTGMPKGVIWRHEDVFFALGGGIDPMTNQRIERPELMVEKGKGGALTFLPIAPLMHGATQWAVMGQSFVGSKVVLMGKFDPEQVWTLVEREKVNSMMITGDAMGRPLIETLAANPGRWDLSSLFLLTSSAVTFSPAVKDEFFRQFPNLMMIDAIGSSETGNNGMVMVQAGQTAMKGGPTVTKVGNTVVLDEELKPIPAGSEGRIGKIARVGDIPIGYYKDEKKTAETFVTVGGVRYAMPGDYGMIEADGRITLLGRGSVSINSGGEKIFPEEVETAVKSHPAVFDCTIVGVPDERWGERVAAVIEFRPGQRVTLEDLQSHCRTKIAGYKVPRQICEVERIVRSPSGKPDYRWAKQVASGAARAR
jgi:acyl-CoA synthetase (AMP-forming)/AMP-acid ligase II